MKLTDTELERLLERAAPPSPPDWFEARLLARLRREREAGFWRRLGWSLGGLPRVGLAAAVLAVCLSGAFLTLGPGGAPGKTAVARNYSDDQVYAALEAFVSFSEENAEWVAEAF